MRLNNKYWLLKVLYWQLNLIKTKLNLTIIHNNNCFKLSYILLDKKKNNYNNNNVNCQILSHFKIFIIRPNSQ